MVAVLQDLLELLAEIELLRLDAQVGRHAEAEMMLERETTETCSAVGSAVKALLTHLANHGC